MKIVFINKSDSGGGAAIAAHRILKCLQHHHQTENHFVVAKQGLNEPYIHRTREKWGWYVESGIDLVSRALGFQAQWFPLSGAFIRKVVRDIRPDIISLHNIHSGYFPIRLLPVLSRQAPLVWTFHDMWPITAGCAHTHGQTEWKRMKAGPEERRYYPQMGLNQVDFMMKQKKTLYAESDLTVVTPSSWLADLASQSPLLEGKRIVRIPHPLDTEVFKPQDRSAVRSRLGLPVDEPVFVFSAEFLSNNEWKGGPDLLRILRGIDGRMKRKGLFLAMGRGQLNWGGLEHLAIRQTGFLVEERDVADYLAAADVLIYPSRADSFGLVLAESLACGTPVVTFSVDACPEVAADGVGGFAVPPNDIDAFVDRVMEIIQRPSLRRELSEGARRHAEDHYAAKIVADQYHRVFMESIEGRGRRRGNPASPR